MTAKVRVGIAGAGWVATARHLPSYLRHPLAEVVAVYDRRQERAGALAARAPGEAFATADLDRFLAEGLDVVSIATSPWSHCEIAVKAAAAGAHVFTEKPMAMDGQEARAMASAAADAGRLLSVSHNFLHSKAMQQTRRRLAGAPVDYAAGLQLSAKTRRLPEWYQSLPGGLMFDEVPHLVYTLNDLLGGGLRLDHARGDVDDAGQPRGVELLVAGRTGRGQLTMVFDAPVSEWHVMASASTGVVGLDLFRDISVGLAPDGAHGALDIARSSASALAGHALGFAKAGTRFVTKRQLWGHDALIGRFVDAVAHNGPAPVSVNDALAVVDFIDAVLASLGLSAHARA
jgi:scyllo-inositol 2-dehydrogenase (NADP+)